MKIAKSTYLNRIVEIKWHDPIGCLRVALKELPKGFAALGHWTEYGVVDDITDGVLRILHSKGRADISDETWEVTCSYIVEDLITEIRILEPVLPPINPASINGPAT